MYRDSDALTLGKICPQFMRMKDWFAALNPVDSPSSHTEQSSRGPSRNRRWAKNVSKRKRITEAKKK